MQLANMRGCFLLTTKSVRHCLGLSQLHLDNALCIGLETREPSHFPFEQFTSRISHSFLCKQNVMFLILNSIGIVAV